MKINQDNIIIQIDNEIHSINSCDIGIREPYQIVLSQHTCDACKTINHIFASILSKKNCWVTVSEIRYDIKSFIVDFISSEIVEIVLYGDPEKKEEA